MKLRGKEPFNIVTLVKGDEKYFIVYDDESFEEARRQIGRWAANPDLSFTWYDAAACNGKLLEHRA